MPFPHFTPDSEKRNMSRWFFEAVIYYVCIRILTNWHTQWLFAFHTSVPSFHNQWPYSVFVHGCTSGTVGFCLHGSKAQAKEPCSCCNWWKGEASQQHEWILLKQTKNAKRGGKGLIGGEPVVPPCVFSKCLPSHTHIRLLSRGIKIAPQGWTVFSFLVAKMPKGFFGLVGSPGGVIWEWC